MSREQRRPSGFGGGACVVGALLLLSSCTTYEPLDAGSEVPWAKKAEVRVAAAPKPAPAAPEAPKAEPEPAPPAEPEPASVSRAEPALNEPVPKKTRGTVIMTEVTPPSEGARAAAPSGSVHRVKAGEALAPIARRYGVSTQDLAAANQISPPYVIKVGQTLRIPAAGEAKSEAKTETAKAEPERLVEPAPKRPAASERYVVQKGDALVRIARRFEVPMGAIARANQITPPYRLQVGQTLTIPGAGTAVADERPGRGAVQVAGGDPGALSGEGFLWPVSGQVVARFGSGDGEQRREGIAIAARKGAPVRATEDGTVVYAGDAIRGYGRMILVRHHDGYVSAYAHNSAILVNVGDTVERGQVIARVGDTGDVEQAQLHFELRKGRKPIDPETVLVKDATALASTE